MIDRVGEGALVPSWEGGAGLLPSAVREGVAGLVLLHRRAQLLDQCLTPARWPDVYSPRQQTEQVEHLTFMIVPIEEGGG